MILLDGKALLSKIKLSLCKEVSLLKNDNKRPPHLAAILVGDNPASQTYVNAKIKACNEIGFESTVINYSTNVKQDVLLEKIKDVNDSDNIDGLIVQLPLPNHIDEHLVTHSISHKKDVDGFHPINIGRMVLGLDCFLPATPFGIISLLDEYNIATSGKKCLVIGRSHIVGTPMSILMSRNTKIGNATVTLAHSKTKNLDSLTKEADIIIVAIGVPTFLKSHMIKKNAIVIDVGIHRIPSQSNKSGYKLVGDVDFHELKEKTAYITPVPGGVGPMTIASLLQNTLYSAKKIIYSHT
ncbi:MAG: bifunctional 5,10-methylene-tetrahydrofolate dehydrogenase/5,10-methylene-tetrahydrofolate cyclohydrolase [Flavobacteriales bacterium]|jgi:methylenetetrahydrofolate dehydrogenase (NADP+)/methenyltetrahydrofolate cyclohydrolase|nr:bifunctional 5,10-methylene-tetrahydrofolate dehydrogenase/5,10-methylene-tetrahydrofolate cyclohydrolase [Flavobacteriales bacterium]|tara:strand:+ start:5065 stop:5952 length:888 start_codon:yes stop_codon:yes gene_type:complete